MKNIYLFLFLMFSFAFAFAQEVAVSLPLPPADFLSQVLQAIQGFGGLSTVAKISTIILLIVASMKVTILNQYIWSKLGEAKAWVAPLLGLIAGVLGIGAGGQPITLASVFAYVAAGGGAVILHELLDSLKAIPGIGPIYVAIIDFISESVVLGGKAK